MKIGLTYNLKTDKNILQHFKKLPEDAFEEFDSPETIAAIVEVLTGLGHECSKLGYGRPAIDKIMDDKVDFVFNIAEGYKGRSREAHMPALFEMIGIPYSGPDPLAAAITLDKIAAKRIATYLGIKTPDFMIIRQPDEFNYDSIKYPAILKPAYEGSSKGIRLDSKVNNPAEAKEQADWLYKNYVNEPIIVEQFLRGKEVTVGLIGNNKPEILGMMEIEPVTMELKDFIYSLEVKRNYREMVKYHCPPGIGDFEKQRLEKAVRQLYQAFGCRDIARFDFRFDEQNDPYFLECNPLPGLNPVSGDIVIMAKLLGIEYKTLIERILKSALKRCKL